MSRPAVWRALPAVVCAWGRRVGVLARVVNTIPSFALAYV